MVKRVDETKAGKAISAYVIMKGSKLIGKVQAHFSEGGTCTVNAWDFSPKDETRYMSATASGYGYDKFTAAISGMVFDGKKLSNHCGASLKLPKKGYFTKTDKLPKGYRLANGGYYEKATGNRVRDCVVDALGESVGQRRLYTFKEPQPKRGSGFYGPYPDDMEKNPDAYKAVTPEEVEYGYSDAYKQSGLDYLRDLGYTIIQAI